MIISNIKRIYSIVIVVFLISIINITTFSLSQGANSASISDDNIDNYAQLWMNGYGSINTVIYSPDSSEYAISSSSGGIFIFNSSTNSLDRKFIFYNDSIDSIDWSPDGKKLLVDLDKEIRILNAISGKKINSFQYDDPYMVKWSPDGSKISFFIDFFLDDAIYVFNLSDEKILFNISRVFDYYSGPYGSIYDWSPDGTLFAYSNDKNITILDSNDGSVLKSIMVEYNDENY